MSKVLTVGTFDTPHSGHIKLFNKCRLLAELPRARVEEGTWDSGEVVVGVNTDSFVYRYKQVMPAYPFEERVKIIENLKMVNRVIENNDWSLQSMLAIQKPDFLIVGSDWACKDYYKQIGVTQDWLDSHKITLFYVEYTQGVSTTILKERINAR